MFILICMVGGALNLDKKLPYRNVARILSPFVVSYWKLQQWVVGTRKNGLGVFKYLIQKCNGETANLISHTEMTRLPQPCHNLSLLKLWQGCYKVVTTLSQIFITTSSQNLLQPCILKL